MRAALLLLGLLVGLVGCTFDDEPEQRCFYEATIGCGPGCTPRIVREWIVCPNPPFDVDGGSGQ